MAILDYFQAFDTFFTQINLVMLSFSYHKFFYPCPRNRTNIDSSYEYGFASRTAAPLDGAMTKIRHADLANTSMPG